MSRYLENPTLIKRKKELLEIMECYFSREYKRYFGGSSFWPSEWKDLQMIGKTTGRRGLARPSNGKY